MKKLLFLLGLGLFSQITIAQQLINLYESQFYYPAVPDSNKIADGGIVDINSDIIVRIDKTELLRRIGELFPTQENTWSNLDELTALLSNQNQILNLFNQSLESNGGDPNFDLYSQLAVLQMNFLDAVMESDFLLNMYGEAEVAYAKRYGRIPAASDPPQELFILQYFAEQCEAYAEAAAAEAKETFQSSDISFLMAGFLVGKDTERPIHLNKRIDTYEPENYVVPRWVYTLSEGDMEELEEAVAMAKTLQETTAANKDQLIQIIQNTISSDDCLTAIKIEFDNIRQQIPSLEEDAQQQVRDLLLEPYLHLDKTLKSLRALKNNDDQNTSLELLTGVNLAIQNTLVELEAFAISYAQNFEVRLQQIADSVVAQVEIDQLISVHENCVEAIQNDLDKLDQIGTFFNQIMIPTEQGAKATLAIGDEVRRLRPNEIPEEFRFRLRRTGKRVNGDQIEIIAMAEVPSAEEPIQLETRYFSMQQIELYSEAKVMVTLANPISGSSKIDLESEFQFAPSYSVLFRWGSRKSRAWNNFWNVGIGINFAAPDFDTDGIPEFGAGLVVTSFKDFVSTGISYNFGLGTPYYFIGFRVPFTSTVLPILNSVDTETRGSY